MKSIFGGVAIVHLAVFSIRLFGNVEFLEDFWFSGAGRIFFAASTVLGITAAVYFAVDSLRREYPANRELAVAVAITGVLSFGLVTPVYYLVWGRLPISANYSSCFCDRCLNETEEFNQSISLLTVNFVNGGRLIGNADKCSECGSVIRTHLFLVFGIPVFSRGSFRVLVPARDQVLLRKRAFYWPHLISAVLIAATIIGVLVMVVLRDK